MEWLWAALGLNSLISVTGGLLAALRLTTHLRRRNGRPAEATAPGDTAPGDTGPGGNDSSGQRAADGLSLIVPIKGADEHTEGLLTALVQSALSRPVEYVFAMESADDPAYPVCERVAAANPDRAVRVVLTGTPDGLMGKQHNLAVASRQARYPLIGSMDADVLVDHTTLATLTAELDTPGTGTAFALPYYRGDAPAGGTIVSVYTNYYFIPYMGAWAATGTAPFIIGALWVGRHEILQQAGGFGQFGRTVSDDAIIGQSVRRLGLRNRLARATVAMPAENLDLKGGVRHLSKWLGMLRAEGIPALLATLGMWYPLFWAALAAVVAALSGGRFMTPSLWLLGAVAALRCAWAVTLNMAVYRTKPLRHVGALLAYELLAPLLLVVPALFRDTIEWKGRRYRIGKGGRILEMTEQQTVR